MSKKYLWLFAPILLFSLVACMCSGLSGLQSLGSGLQAAATSLPAMLTSAPTELGPMETMAAQQTTPSGTLTPGHLGVSLAEVKSVLELSQQFTFTDGTVNGQPASIATMTGPAALSFADIAKGLSIEFIGDPADLTQIHATIPDNGQAAVEDEGVGVLTIIASGFMQPGITSTFLPWVTQNYTSLQVGDKTQTTIQNWVFTLERTSTSMLLTIDPAQ